MHSENHHQACTHNFSMAGGRGGGVWDYVQLILNFKNYVKNYAINVSVM
jgi:hypothetical protein